MFLIVLILFLCILDKEMFSSGALTQLYTSRPYYGDFDFYTNSRHQYDRHYPYGYYGGGRKFYYNNYNPWNIYGVSYGGPYSLRSRFKPVL